MFSLRPSSRFKWWCAFASSPVSCLSSGSPGNFVRCAFSGSSFVTVLLKWLVYAACPSVLYVSSGCGVIGGPDDGVGVRIAFVVSFFACFHVFVLLLRCLCLSLGLAGSSLLVRRTGGACCSLGRSIPRGWCILCSPHF